MWDEFFKEEEKKPYYKELMDKVNLEYENYICYPKYENIFHAFKMTDIDNLKVVILGQDPYHEENQAHGLAFSVLCKKLPPSLKNIYKEIESDLGVKVNQDGNLDYLASQGVLLLNTLLTVREHEAFSHKGYGWEIFSDDVIKYLNKINRPIVFILWGAPAISKEIYLNNPMHYIIKSPHPSPLSAYRGFFGSKPFSKCNEFLKANNIEEIRWTK
jgi:uracil-DNA glycosylase